MGIDLLVEQLKRDKGFAAFLIQVTGATGNLQITEAMKRLEAEANASSGLAAMFRGVGLLNGLWGNKDQEEARRYFVLAADRGVAGAQALLAESYWNGGYGFLQDKVKSTVFVEKLVNNENADKSIRALNALYLGNRLVSGDGITKNICRGVQMFAMSANLGNAVAMRVMGYERENQSRCLSADKAAALNWFERGADAGDAASAAEAGRMQQFGLAGPRDFAAAERHYLAAATPFADRQLAWIYAKGLARPDQRPDYSKALAYARRAADAGDGHAMITVGLLYEYGLDVELNSLEAFRWYGKAAAAGELRGVVIQAAALMNGCVGRELMPNWVAELTDVAESDKADKSTKSAAAYYLGNVYLKGLADAPVDERRAARLFEQACNGGNDDACVMVAARRPAGDVSPAVAAASQRAKQEGLKTDGEACRLIITSRSASPDTFP